MKNQFINFLNTELESKNALMAMNGINEEDKVLIQTQIDNLTTILADVEAMDEATDNTEVVEALKETVTAMGEQLAAIAEKINQNKKEDTTEEMTQIDNNFLDTKNAVHAFAEVVRNAETRKNFATAWAEVLKTNGITIAEGSEEGFLPTAVKSRILDIWDRNADWLKDLHIIGAKRYQIRTNTSDQTANDSRAKGFKKGNTKTEQELTFTSKDVTCQFIYKIQSISLEDEWNDDGALIDYIVSELVDQILYEEKRAILVGDGRESSSDDKITSIESIATAVATAAATHDADNQLIDEYVTLVESLKNDNGKAVYLFMPKADLTSLRRVVASDTATPMYMGKEQVAEMIGVDRIITTDLLSTSTGTRGIALIPSDYALVGENVLNPSMYTWHDGWKNLDNYRYEVMVGGALEKATSAAILKNA